MDRIIGFNPYQGTVRIASSPNMYGGGSSQVMDVPMQNLIGMPIGMSDVGINGNYGYNCGNGYSNGYDYGNSYNYSSNMCNGFNYNQYNQFNQGNCSPYMNRNRCNSGDAYQFL